MEKIRAMAKVMSLEDYAAHTKDVITFMGANGLKSSDMLWVADSVTCVLGLLLLTAAAELAKSKGWPPELAAAQIEPIRAELLGMVDRQKVRFQMWPDEPQQDRTS